MAKNILISGGGSDGIEGDAVGSSWKEGLGREEEFKPVLSRSPPGARSGSNSITYSKRRLFRDLPDGHIRKVGGNINGSLISK